MISNYPVDGRSPLVLDQPAARRYDCIVEVLRGWHFIHWSHRYLAFQSNHYPRELAEKHLNRFSTISQSLKSWPLAHAYEPGTAVLRVDQHACFQAPGSTYESCLGMHTR